MKGKNRFALNEDCFLVKGAKRGAIYDLKTGDIYSIDETSKQILDLCERKHNLAEVFRIIPNINQREILGYLKNLNKLKLGRFLEDGQMIKKVCLRALPRSLNFVWLELTDRCNLRCLHCYAEPDIESKSGGVKTGQENLSFSDWKQIIEEITQLGCKKIQFIGGEPMLFGDKIFDLVDLSKELGCREIEIFTNATLLSEKDIESIAQCGIKVAVSVYSNQAEIHDKITRKNGSYNRTLSNIKKMKELGIKMRFGIVVMKQNQDSLEETLGFFKKLGGENSVRGFDLVRNVGRGKGKDLFPDKFADNRLIKKADFQKISREDFIKKSNGHSCWQGKICITSNGDVLPCIMAREEICGNIKKQSLSEIVQDEDLQNLWGLSKDKIETCKDCEYRYACFDCRPQAKTQGNLYSRGSDCLYNPFEGRWED